MPDLTTNPLREGLQVERTPEPNTVVIADNTRRMLGSLFDYRDLGTKSVAGIDYPVHVWRPRWATCRAPSPAV